MTVVINKITAIILGLSLLGAASLQAHETPGPVGFWSGHPDGVDRYPVYLSVKANGDCSYSEPNGKVFLSGVCSWGQTTSTGGILTLHYLNVTPTQTFHNKLYIGITWLNGRSVRARFGNGPHETGILNRL